MTILPVLTRRTIHMEGLRFDLMLMLVAVVVINISWSLETLSIVILLEVEPDNINESLGKTKDEPNHVNGVVVAVKQVLLGVDHATINKE